MKCQPAPARTPRAAPASGNQGPAPSKVTFHCREFSFNHPSAQRINTAENSAECSALVQAALPVLGPCTLPVLCGVQRGARFCSAGTSAGTVLFPTSQGLPTWSGWESRAPHANNGGKRVLTFTNFSVCCHSQEQKAVISRTRWVHQPRHSWT